MRASGSAWGGSKVRRISYDHIRARHSLHHARTRHSSLQLFNFPFNLRVAFHLLVFLFNLLFGHFELSLKFPPLVQVIKKGNHQKRCRHLQQQAKPQFQHGLNRSCQIHIHILGKL